MKRQQREAWLSHDHTTTSSSNNHNESKVKTPHHSDITTSSSSSSNGDSNSPNCSSISTSSATTAITTTATTTKIIKSNSASSTVLPINPTPGNKCYRGGRCVHHQLHYQHKTRRRPRESEAEPHFRLRPHQWPQFCCDRGAYHQHCYHPSDHEQCEQPLLLLLLHCCCCDRSRSDDWGGLTTPTFPNPRPLDDNDVSVVYLLKCNNKRDITSTNHNWNVCDIGSLIIVQDSNHNPCPNPGPNNNNNNNNKIYNSTDNNNNNKNIYNKCHCYHFPRDVKSKVTISDASDAVGQEANRPGCTRTESGNLGSQPSGDPNTSRGTDRSFVRDKLTNGREKTKQDFYKRGPSFHQLPNADQHRKFTHEMLRRYTPSQTRWLKYSLLILFLNLMIFAPSVLAYPRPNVIEKANKTVVLFYTYPCRPVSNHQLRRQLGEAYDEERMADSEENVKRSIQMSTMSPTEDEQSNDAEIDEYFDENVQRDSPGVHINDLEDEEEDEDEGKEESDQEEEEEEEEEENDSKRFDEDDEIDSVNDAEDSDENGNDDEEENEKGVVKEDDEVSLHGERLTLTVKKGGSERPIGKKESHLVGARGSRNDVDQKNGRQTKKQIGGRRRKLASSKQKAKVVGRKSSSLSRISSRGRRDLSSASGRNQTKKTNYKVMLSVKYRGQPSLNRKRIARAAELSNNWHCEMQTQWKKMQDGYFPSYLQTGHCVSKSCFFNMYRCIPKKYTIKVLKRDPNRCNPIPTYGLNTTYEERWIFERFHVTVCCQCGSSKRKTSRRRKRKRPRHR